MEEDSTDNSGLWTRFRSVFWDHVYLVEVLLGTLLLMGTSVLFQFNSRLFVGTHPHPFLFLVILISLRHGFRSGFVASLFLSGVYVAGGKLEATLPGPIWSYSTMSVPLQIMLTGSIVGEIREKQIRRFQYVSGRLDDTEEKLKKLEESQQNLDHIRKKLQKRIAIDKSSFYKLYDTFNQLMNRDQSDTAAILAGVISEQLEAGKVGVYDLDGDTFRSRARIGDLPETLPVVEARKDPLIDHTLATGELSDIRGVADEQKPKSPYLFCSPIGENNYVDGLILVGDMPFLRFHYRSKHLLLLFSTWYTHFTGSRHRTPEI
jgi:hypothetical protein